MFKFNLSYGPLASATQVGNRSRSKMNYHKADACDISSGAQVAAVSKSFGFVVQEQQSDINLLKYTKKLNQQP